MCECKICHQFFALADFVLIRVAASMGPRRFSRGISLSGCGRSAGHTRFNGATAFQPWNFHPQVLECDKCHSFNGATAFQPWNSENIQQNTTFPYRRFNGATAFQPWNWLDRETYEPWERRFNGATAFQPWNFCGTI